MNKLNLCCLSLLLFTGTAFAQSKTYKIEELEKPLRLMPTVAPADIFKSIHKNFLKHSVDTEIAQFGQQPVITGYLYAYQNHCPITISPDIAWLLISQGFANHVNTEPEKLRSKFVNFEGQKMLTVQRDMDGKKFSDIPWEEFFPEFTAQIGSFTGKKLIDNLSADFSTTTPTTLISSQITIMESMREFFKYKVMIMGCGIPEVTVEGTVKDWEKIIQKLDYLAQYDLEWWTSELKPVIQKIIETKKGKLDKQFWMNMVKYHKKGTYGSYDGIDGWLLKFYPYHTGGSRPVTKDTDLDAYSAYRKIYLKRSNFKEIKSVGQLPKEIVNVPFILEIQDKQGNVVSTQNMEFWAGFFGLKQDKQTFNVKPEIGWAVNAPTKIE